MIVFDIAHVECRPDDVRAAAVAELLSGTALPADIRRIREAQATNLRGHASATRGLSDDALRYFVGVVEAGLPDKSMLDYLSIEVAITPEHRRMFPELPEKDMLLIGRVDGEIAWDFVNVESRAA